MTRIFTTQLFLSAALLSGGVAAPAAPTSLPPLREIPLVSRLFQAATPPVIYGAWRASKIGGGGYILGIEPTSNPQTYYAYADVGGPWRSDNGGKRWRLLSSDFPPETSPGARDVSADPRNPLVVLCARGNQWNAADGVYRSENGGQTWRKVLAARFESNEEGRWDGRIFARDPKNPDVLLVATSGGGVSRSDDAGQTWKTQEPANVYPLDLKFDREGKRLYLCARAVKMWRDGDYKELQGGFYASDDQGRSWQKLGDDTPSELCPDPATASRMWGIFSYHAVKYSDDGGKSWINATEGLPQGEDSGYTSETHFQSLASGPDFLVTASTRGTFHKLDLTQTPLRWQKVERQGVTQIYEGAPWYARTKPNSWEHFGAALATVVVDPRNPKHWFFTDWYSTYQTFDAGAHWTLTLDGIELTVLHALQQDPKNAGVVHLGMADNGYMQSRNGGERFQTPELNANMKCLAVSPRDSQRVYGAGDAGNGQWRASQVFVSADGGGTWSRSPMTGLPDMSAHNCNSIAVAMDDPMRVYLCLSGEVKSGGGVYVSRDGAKSWSKLSDGLPQEAVFHEQIWGVGREIAAGFKNQVIAVSRDQGEVFRLEGETWTKVNAGQKEMLNDIVADPQTPGLFYLAAHDGVHRTRDGGATWTKIDTRSVEHLAVDMAHPQRVAAGSDDGLILSEDGGETWRLLDRALPNRRFCVPAFSGERLLAATNGNGVFWTALSPSGELPVFARAASPEREAFPLAWTLLPNGDMTQGAGAPDGWGVWTANGQLSLLRDTQEFVDAPASLRLDSVNGLADGSTSLPLDPTRREFSLRGRVQTTGTLEACLVAVQSFDAGGKQLAWTNLTDARAFRDWTTFNGQVSLPANTARAQLVLTFKGQGSAWLDSVQIAP